MRERRLCSVTEIGYIYIYKDVRKGKSDPLSKRENDNKNEEEVKTKDIVLMETQKVSGAIVGQR